MSKLLLFPLVLVALTAKLPTSMSATGYVTDTFCGRRGANHLHGERARNEVASGRALYAIYDEKTKQLYILEPQSTAAQYAGQRVRITGTLGETPITRAGQTGVYPERSRRAPDAVATYKSRDGSQKPVNAVSSDSASQSTATGAPRSIPGESAGQVHPLTKFAPQKLLTLHCLYVIMACHDCP